MCFPQPKKAHHHGTPCHWAQYISITELSAELHVNKAQDLSQTLATAQNNLLSYFHPLYGGSDQRGWPFGQDIDLGIVYQQLLNITGVEWVQNLTVALTDRAGNVQSAQAACLDVLTLPKGTLPHLSSPVMNLKAYYAHR